MIRFLLTTTVLGVMVATATAQSKKKAPAVAATLPVLGDQLPVAGSATWPKRDWLYDVPSVKDASGKIVVHWFCAPKATACTEDLARLVTLKENGRVYVVAHINGSKTQAKKLDPIRESEGVGRGTLAFGRGVKAMMKQMGVAGPASVVVDLDGKVAFVTTSSNPTDLDARDKKVTDLVAAIKEYVASSSESPKGLKAGDKFSLSTTIKLAPWLTYSKKTPMEFKAMVPPDFKCDAKELKGDQIKIEGQMMTATITCSAPRGIYEARGDLRFGYEDPNNAPGLGTEGAKWKFEIKP